MSEYLAVWPIVDNNRTTLALAIEAEPLLREMLDDQQLAALGPIAWSRESDYLSARIQVQPIEHVDQAPWESREAAAEELFGLGASRAYAVLMAERYGLDVAA